MALWEKKEIQRELIKDICQKYGCEPLTASILARRQITLGEDVLFFLETDPRYLHSPFLFSEMEDAVDRIFAAREEGEKVLIFGDRDADGITSTVLLYHQLKKLGLEVQWRLPKGNDSYGLNLEAINEFAQNDGTLIITVDCGISNNKEVAYANDLGIDVIIVDHHDAPENLPEPSIIINPKLADAGYPFKGLSGCGVTYKVVAALQFAKSDWYKQQVCLLNVRPLNEAFCIDVIKTVNCREIARLSETIIPGETSISNTRLVPFLQGQQIFVWDELTQRKMLSKIFGSAVDFHAIDIRSEVGKLIPTVASMSLLRLAPQSKILKYCEKAVSEIDSFFNIFITFMQKKIVPFDETYEQDLQLVALSTLADIVPLKNENRIMTKIGLQSLNRKPRSGLQELLLKQNLLGKRITSTDISWNVIPLLNAAGRLGQPELVVQFFLTEDPLERENLAQKIVELNNLRKQMGAEILPIVQKKAYEVFSKFENKILFICEPQIHRGLTGIIAGKLMQSFKVPAMIITQLEDNTMVGSIRSTRGFAIQNLLLHCSDLFLNYGGHAFAGGFSFQAENLGLLEQRIENYVPFIELDKDSVETFVIDAEIPHEYFTPDLMNLIDKFEPYGEENPALTFLARQVTIVTVDIIGKTEAKHLRLTLSAGKYKWPAVYWNAAERLNHDFKLGDHVDIVFQINRNTFNGNETPQVIIHDLQKSNEGE